MFLKSVELMKDSCKSNNWFIIKLYFLISLQELIYVWNGFKVLNQRPDLVELLMNLVEYSLHKIKQTKGKCFTRDNNNEYMKEIESELRKWSEIEKWSSQ